MTSPCSMQETGHSKPVHWDNPEGWDGEGGGMRGTHAHLQLIHVNVWQKPQQYCKVISLHLKLINFFNMKKKKRRKKKYGYLNKRKFQEELYVSKKILMER